MVPEFKFALIEELKEKTEFLPVQGEPLSTGYDCRCAEPNGVILRPGEYVKINLGFRVFSPSDWWLSLSPRSSSFWSKKLHALYGVIDESYEGVCCFLAQYSPNMCTVQQNLKIEFGEKVAQLIPVPRQRMTVSSISNEEYNLLCKKRNGIRGAGGFGSTGHK